MSRLDLRDPSLLARCSPGGPTLTITSGLIARWEADAITGLSDGDPVATWPDTSGAGRNATQSSGTLKPLFKTNIFGTAPAVRFDGSNDVMTFTPTSIPSWTMFIAWRVITGKIYSGAVSWRAASQAGFIFQDIDGSAAGWRPNFLVTNTSNVEVLTKWGDSIYGSPGPALPQKGVHMHRWNPSGSAHHRKKNGGAIGSYGSDGYTGWPTAAEIGHCYDYVNADIGAILVYDNALSDGDAGTVEAYLNAKFPCF